MTPETEILTYQHNDLSFIDPKHMPYPAWLQEKIEAIRQTAPKTLTYADLLAAGHTTIAAKALLARLFDHGLYRDQSMKIPEDITTACLVRSEADSSRPWDFPVLTVAQRLNALHDFTARVRKENADYRTDFFCHEVYVVDPLPTSSPSRGVDVGVDLRPRSANTRDWLERVKGDDRLSQPDWRRCAHSYQLEFDWMPIVDHVVVHDLAVLRRMGLPLSLIFRAELADVPHPPCGHAEGEVKYFNPETANSSAA